MGLLTDTADRKVDPIYPGDPRHTTNPTGGPGNKPQRKAYSNKKSNTVPDDFSWQDYLDLNPDVKKAGEEALDPGKTGFNPDYWRKGNNKSGMPVGSLEDMAYAHWLDSGYKEGRQYKKEPKKSGGSSSGSSGSSGSSSTRNVSTTFGLGGNNNPPPSLRTIKPEDTVRFQLNSLLQEDSPYMQAARTEGKQYANDRGLLNSSIGAEAVETARIKAALPIASQDATAYLTQGLNNQNTENKFTQAALDRALSEHLSVLDINSREAMTRLQVNARYQLLDLEQRYRLESQMFSELQQASLTPGLSSEQQQGAINEIYRRYNTQSTWLSNFNTL